MMAVPDVFPAPLAAAEQAFDRADFPQALALARPVFEDEGASRASRSLAGVLMVQCLHRQGEVSAVLALLAPALALAEAAGEAGHAFDVLRLASLACSESRRFDDALRLARELNGRTEGDVGRQILAVTALASCFERMGDPWQALRLLEPLPAQARALGAPAVRVRVLVGLSGSLMAMHHVLRDAGDLAEAQRVLEQATVHAADALPIALGLGDVWMLVIVRSTLADALLRRGQLVEAAQALALARADAQAHGLRHLLWRLRCVDAEIHLAQGDAARARAEVEAVLAELPPQQVVSPLLRLHQVAYRAYVAQGDVVRALAHLEHYLVLERQRTAEQLQAQARELVSRVEVENAVKQAERASGEAREHRRRADALADVAMKDALTGVLNRRGLDERLAALRRQPNRLAVAMVDIDHFKRVNDTWGHAVGDRVLAHLGGLFREHLRPRDVVARYGGEEFVLLLAGLALDEAVEVCERLREKVASLGWEGVAPGLQLTISIGLAFGEMGGEASALAPSGPDAAALLQPADAALYRAKALGRNRVELAP